MNDLSEACYYAGWLNGTEYFVPELCRRAIATGNPQPWGHGVVTPEHATKLRTLADQLGHWADLDQPGVGYVPFQPFPVPTEYLASLDRELEYKRQRSERPT
jgi:hypothetical protein